MIGVEAAESEHSWVREFFELFKTPWEFARPAAVYDVLIRTHFGPSSAQAALVVQYDAPGGLSSPVGTEAHFGRDVFILYGAVTTFPEAGSSLVFLGDGGGALVQESGHDGATVVRIGYSLFREVENLLGHGQPEERAAFPSLELHIALLRSVITRSGTPLVELPPAPPGYDFMVCLSHDMDHPALRSHFLDHTMFGFLQRATLGTAVRVAQGRLTFRRALKNLLAAAALPLIYLRLFPDIWRRFDRFLEIERGKGATYFFIPRRGHAGRKREGVAPAKRAAGYELAPLAGQISGIAERGNEIGVHGIDSWLEADDGRAEKSILARQTGREATGIRMHWLYFDADSPRALDAAGFAYDSTVGYNGAVGYRAGTTQAYRPPGVSHLLELPLHAMDTALFYPGNLNLTDREAVGRVGRLADDFARFGGAMTINWHDRSIAAERLWDESYLSILRHLESRRAWFPTCGQAVEWFNARRSARFECESRPGGGQVVRVRLDKAIPPTNLRLRVHLPPPALRNRPLAERADPPFEDHSFSDHSEAILAS